MMFKICALFFSLLTCQQMIKINSYEFKSESLTKDLRKYPPGTFAYKVYLNDFPEKETYKVLWYSIEKGESLKDKTFIKEGSEYVYIPGDANPGYGAVYGTRIILAQCVSANNDSTHLKEIGSYRYLKRPGNRDNKEPRIKE